MAAPVFQAAGTAVVGDGASAIYVTPQWGVHAAGHVALLLIESGRNFTAAAPLTTANGFTLLGTIGANGTTTLTVYWCRATSSAMPAPQVTVAPEDDHIYARILTWSGCADTGDPWDVFATAYDSSITTLARSAPAITTTVSDTTVVAVVAASLDTASSTFFSSWANSSLTSVTERADGMTSVGNGGGIGVADGVKAVAGAVGTTSVNIGSVGGTTASLTIALKPPPPVSSIAGSTAGAATAVGAIAGAGRMSGVIAAAAVATALLSGAGAVLGSSVGASTASAALSGQGQLAGATAGTSSASATLSSPYLSGSSAGVAVATATLSGAGALTGMSAGTATATAALTGTGWLSGTASGAGSATATLVGTCTSIITVTWSHRDRTLQADQLIDTTSTSIGPEPGTTYTVRFYRGGILRSTITGIATNQATWAPGAAGVVRVEVEAVRNGLVSWQALAHSFNFTCG